VPDHCDVWAPAATLAAESAITVFSVSFAQWNREGEQRSMADLERTLLAELRGLTGGAA
jgi:hypothetical protein